MMKHFILIISLVVFCSHIAGAQNANDSVRVDLEKLNPKFPENILKPVYIEIDTAVDRKTVKKQMQFYPDYRRWMFGIAGGFGTRIAQDPINIPDDLAYYRKGLKTGACFGFSTSYFISPNIAVGMGYSFYSLANSTDYMSYEHPKDNIFDGSRSDKIGVHFFGPTLTIRVIPKKNKLYATYDFMLGYSVFNDNMRLYGVEYDYTGNSFGFSSSVGADFMISKDYSAGVALKLSAASAKKLQAINHKIPKQEIDNIENLSRVSLVFTVKTYR